MPRKPRIRLCTSTPSSQLEDSYGLKASCDQSVMQLSRFGKQSPQGGWRWPKVTSEAAGGPPYYIRLSHLLGVSIRSELENHLC